ncbi:MAG: sigma-70 family RNA polymerase sigma factor [Ruminococcus sp.]
MFSRWWTLLNSKSYHLLNDDMLAALSKKGDEKAFEEITIRYIKLICTIAKEYNAYGYETQDFVQEGLLAFLIACESYVPDSGSSFKNYAVKCAKNRFKDIIKKANSKGTVPTKDIVSIDSLEQEKDNLQNVEDYVLEREYLKTLMNHISSMLNSSENQVFTMYLQGYSYKDIADKLNLTTKQIDNILQKIKRKLRNR